MVALTAATPPTLTVAPPQRQVFNPVRVAVTNSPRAARPRSSVRPGVRVTQAVSSSKLHDKISNLCVVQEVIIHLHQYHSVEFEHGDGHGVSLAAGV